MADFTQALFRIDPTQGLVDYVNTVKPYHTKVLDVLVEYVYTEKIDTNVKDRWSWVMSFTRPESAVEYSCGYGYRWDPFGLASPESTPTSRIINALGKLLIDVNTTVGTTINIIRNTTGYQLATNDPIVFQNIPLELYDPSLNIEYITPGRTYYIASITPTTLTVSLSAGGSPIAFGAVGTLEILPQGLSYNTFLVEPTLNASSYDCLTVNTSSNQLAFVNGYNITGVDTAQKKWHFRVGTWTSGAGYPANTTTSVSLIGGTGAGTQAQADIITDATGTIVDVVITDPGTKTYVIGDNLIASLFPGFTFTVSVPQLTIPLVANDYVYINGNTSVTANGKYTVASIQGSALQVVEVIPPLTGASGSLYMVDSFDAVPYWPSGLKVTVNTVGTLPGPLVNGGSYYFIPTAVTGVFNLATTRYPQEFGDFVDLTSIGGPFTISRAEPFTPGDVVTVFGTQNNHNNGEYVVSTITHEGANFRIGVMQNIPRTTPNPSPQPYDGAMALYLGSYDMPQVCPATRTPDLYANAYINEKLEFTFHINEYDYIGVATLENTAQSIYSYTTITDGTSTLAGTQLILPTGYDTQLFDVGAIDETLAVAATL